MNELPKNDQTFQVQPQLTRANSHVLQLREKLSNYFMTPTGVISYQWNV